MAEESRKINPKRDKDKIDNLDLSNEHNFPILLKKIRFDNFKQIDNLEIHFLHPISIIAGVNRTGKTTVLMAIACSHLKFMKKNIKNGNLERHTWSSLMKSTNKDEQTKDWNYSITYKMGKKEITRSGKRKQTTRKWSGIGKKESQFKEPEVRYLDLSRLLPARNFGDAILSRIAVGSSNTVSTLVKGYLSYIFEEEFYIDKQFSYQDKDIFGYNSSHNSYSSYNAAAGEEVLTKILTDIIDAPEKSLILIDEIDAGLHPKIQRKLMEVIYYIAETKKSQFIITSHSPSILSCVPPKARIFIEKNRNQHFSCSQNISVNAAMSKMDSCIYPLFDIYCEDAISKKIIQKLLNDFGQEFDARVINIIDCGSCQDTYKSYLSYKETYCKRKVKSGYVCILDADKKNEKPYCDDQDIHFLFGDITTKNPESFLVEKYLEYNPNPNMSYHLENSNNHILFSKMQEFGIASNEEEAFLICWSSFESSNYYPEYLTVLKEFIFSKIEYFTKENL